MTDTLVARPTTYNGIKMRSRLEARVAAFLDENRFDWAYEPRAFASRDGQYLPDFAIEGVRAPLGFGPPTGRMYIDVKGLIDNADREHALAARMEIILASEPDAQLAFADTRGLELGVWKVRWSGYGWRISELVICPCLETETPVFAPGYGQSVWRGFIARCSREDCAGGVIPETASWPTVKVAEYEV